MSNKVKMVSVLMALVLLLAACSSNSNNNNKGTNAPANASGNEQSGQEGISTDEATKDPYEIILAMPIFGAVPKDIEAVQDEISKISKAKINATVKILPISIGAWSQQMNLMMSSGEKLDLAFTFGQGYSTQKANGQIIAISDLIEKYGQGIKQAVGTDYLNSAQIDGKLYGIPTLHNYGAKSGIVMRKDLVEKYNIDVASIKTIDDLDAVFKTIHDNEPNIAPLASALGGAVEQYLDYDMLGDRIGTLPDFDNNLQVVDYFETQEYADLVNKMRSWFKAGYINKDAATSQLSEPDIIKANKAFSYIARLSPGSLELGERQAGVELVSAELQDQAFSTTSDVLVSLWTIAQNSKNPERTMMFLNLMYTDKDIANLLLWGIEGKHYVKVSDNVIDYPTGVNSQNVGYSTQAWLMGNPFLTYTMKTDDPDVWNKVQEFNKEVIPSKALGFTFNTEPVKNEITAINNVLQQYRKILETGTIDPENKLSEFISKLKAAGMDKVISEKQKQLEAWAATK